MLRLPQGALRKGGLQIRPCQGLDTTRVARTRKQWTDEQRRIIQIPLAQPWIGPVLQQGIRTIAQRRIAAIDEQGIEIIPRIPHAQPPAGPPLQRLELSPEISPA